MPGALQKIPFTEELLPKVQGFACGDEPWQRESSDWIKAPSGTGGALDAVAAGCQVWLYATEEDGLIGFGSLGERQQRWPRAKDPPIPASVIPMLGVDSRFWGQPPGPSEERYSARILDDLIHEARVYKETRPILVLYVFLGNERGIRFYERAGFTELHKPYTDKATGRVHKRMVLVLKEGV